MVKANILASLMQALNVPVKVISYAPISSLLALLTINWVTLNQDQDRITSMSDSQSEFDFIVGKTIS